jgi:hypothetical protein
MPDTPSDIPTRVALLEEIIKRIDQRLDRMDQRIDRLEDRIEKMFYWMLGGFGALLVVMGGLFWRVNDIAIQVAVLAQTAGH